MVLVGLALATPSGQPGERDLTAAKGADRLELLTSISAQEVEKDPTKAGRLGDEALALARQLGDRNGEAAAIYVLADVARVRGDHRLALEQFQTARQLYVAIGNQFELGRSLRRIGDIYYFLAAYDQAMHWYLEALRNFEDLAKALPRGKAPLQVAHLEAAIGNVLRAAGDAAAARPYYEKALADYQRFDFPAGVAGAFFNLGLIQQDLNNPAAALRHYEQARTVAVSLGDDYLRALAISSAGSAHLARGDLATAEREIRQAMELNEKTSRPRGILATRVLLAEVQRRLRRPAEALQTLDAALILAEKLGDRRLEADAWRERAASEELMGDHRAALASFRRFSALDTELVGAERASRLNKLRIAHETGKKEQEIQFLTTERRLERLMRWMVTGALVLSCAVLAALYSRYRLGVRSAREIDTKNAELQAAYARVEELSRTDELTGLPNRRAIQERLGLELARCERSGSSLAVIVADIDDFKRCNDEWGHACGDAVLGEVAGLIRSAVRESDGVGRWGGEEFLLVLTDTDRGGAGRLAESIRTLIAQSPICWEGHEITVTLTLGVCVTIAGSSEGTLRRADAAMYAGKRRGKNRVEVAV